MEGIKQKYLIGENGDKYSPMVSSNSVYMSNGMNISEYKSHMEHYCYCAYLPDSTAQSFENTIPSSVILLSDSNYGSLSSDKNKWICNKKGLYTIHFEARLSDVSLSTNQEYHDDRAIYTLVYNSSNELVYRYPCWENQTFRLTMSTQNTVIMDVGYYVNFSMAAINYAVKSGRYSVSISCFE